MNTKQQADGQEKLEQIRSNKVVDLYAREKNSYALRFKLEGAVNSKEIGLSGSTSEEKTMTVPPCHNLGSTSLSDVDPSRYDKLKILVNRCKSDVLAAIHDTDKLVPLLRHPVMLSCFRQYGQNGAAGAVYNAELVTDSSTHGSSGSTHVYTHVYESFVVIALNGNGIQLQYKEALYKSSALSSDIYPRGDAMALVCTPTGSNETLVEWLAPCLWKSKIRKMKLSATQEKEQAVFQKQRGLQCSFLQMYFQNAKPVNNFLQAPPTTNPHAPLCKSPQMMGMIQIRKRMVGPSQHPNLRTHQGIDPQFAGMNQQTFLTAPVANDSSSPTPISCTSAVDSSSRSDSVHFERNQASRSTAHTLNGMTRLVLANASLVEDKVTVELETGKFPLLPSDVLCGNNKVSLEHEGNKMFFHIIESYRLEYQASGQSHRMEIVCEIARELEKHRFLKPIKNTNLWEILQPGAIQNTINQTLRIRNIQQTMCSEEFETAKTPLPLDILCGGDKVCLEHEGNKSYSSIIESYALDYQASSQSQRMEIAEEVFGRLQRCRFLKYNNEMNLWKTLHSFEIREKIGDSLRRGSIAEGFETVKTPLPSDILCLRGSKVHEGNKRYHSIIERHKPKYQALSDETRKRKIIKEIIAKLQANHFLKYNKETDLWETLQPSAIREKIGYSLRRRASRSNALNRTSRGLNTADFPSAIREKIGDSLRHSKCRESSANQSSFHLESFIASRPYALNRTSRGHNTAGFEGCIPDGKVPDKVPSPRLTPKDFDGSYRDPHGKTIHVNFSGNYDPCGNPVFATKNPQDAETAGNQEAKLAFDGTCRDKHGNIFQVDFNGAYDCSGKPILVQKQKTFSGNRKRNSEVIDLLSDDSDDEAPESRKSASKSSSGSQGSERKAAAKKAKMDDPRAAPKGPHDPVENLSFVNLQGASSVDGRNPPSSAGKVTRPDGQTTKVTVVRHKPEGGGILVGLDLFSIKGIGLFLKSIEPRSIFDGSDLRKGMKILSVNGCQCNEQNLDLIAGLLRSIAGKVTIEASQPPKELVQAIRGAGTVSALDVRQSTPDVVTKPTILDAETTLDAETRSTTRDAETRFGSPDTETTSSTPGAVKKTAARPSQLGQRAPAISSSRSPPQLQTIRAPPAAATAAAAALVVPIPPSQCSPQELEALRARARAHAGCNLPRGFVASGLPPPSRPPPPQDQEEEENDVIEVVEENTFDQETGTKPTACAIASLQHALILCKVGVDLLVHGDSKMSVMSLTHALNLINKDLVGMGEVPERARSLPDEYTVVRPSKNTKEGPLLKFEAREIPDLKGSIINRAWVALPSPACTLQGSFDAPLLSDATCLLTAVLLLNLALAHHHQGDLETASIVYHRCSTFLDATVSRLCRENYGSTVGFLMRAARNNETAVVAFLDEDESDDEGMEIDLEVGVTLNEMFSRFRERQYRVAKQKVDKVDLKIAARKDVGDYRNCAQQYLW